MQYPIPANDDAIRSITLITQMIADSLLEGRQNMKRNEPAKDATPVESSELSPAAAEDSDKA